MLWQTAATLGIGYLLGSLSPSYILGRLTKGIDIRQHGDGNAGTVNTFAVLGPVPSVLTALIDASKGLIAAWIAHSLGFSAFLAYLCGFMAIIGHVFPFYLRFRGGQGVGTAVGLMLFFLGFSLRESWLLWWDFAVLLGWVLIFAFICRRGEAVGLVVLPLLVLLADIRTAFCWEIFFLNLVIAHILLINVYNIVVKDVITFRPEVTENVQSPRFFLRPAALALRLLYIEYGRSAALYTLGLTIIVSLAVDVIRARGEETVVSSHRNLYFVYRLPESLHVHISSSTAFLIACFLTILFFDQQIALAAIVFLIFGDMFAKFFGLQYGRTRLLTKTLEGTLACLAVCLMASFFLAQVIEISPLVLVGGAFFATLAELLPIGVNDNLTIPLFSGGVMFLLGIF